MSVLTHAPPLPPSAHTNTMLVIGEVSHYHFYQSLNHHVSHHHQHRSPKYRPTTKKIIPSVPRQHSKAPVNSPLSFIRQQKLPHHITMVPSSNSSSVNLLSTVAAEKYTTTSAVAPSPTILTSSIDTESSQQQSHSSVDLLDNLPAFPNLRQQNSFGLDRQRRPRKVSFNEKVMVICTRFDDDGSKEDEEALETTNESSLSSATTAATTTKDSTSMYYYHGRRHSTGARIITDDHRRQQRWLNFVNTLKPWKSMAYSPPSMA